MIVGNCTLLNDDCRNVLATLPDNSIDSIVTDPPYALVSIVKRFGGENAASAQGDVYARASRGFMGKQWDTGEVAFAVEFWRECLRVLKPGGHVVAFGGTRTYHRLACAIEDAGFEIRDALTWLYGSGFPKSHDISKAIDKAAGAERDIISERINRSTFDPEGEGGGGFQRGTIVTSAPATDEARQWEGWGTALKPAAELLAFARKPLSEPTIAANVLRWGTGAINIDGCRIVAYDGTSTARKPSMVKDTSAPFGKGAAMGGKGSDLGRWPANVQHDGSEEVVAGLGEASRFFYTPKASRKDRGESNTHPTVKPTDLMAYYARLVTPPGGTVLDPFAGSGSTGKACVREGFKFIGVEREPEYWCIAFDRIMKEVEKCGVK